MATDKSAYTLSTADMDAFSAILEAQGNIGAAQPSVGQAQLWNFFGFIRNMAYDHYRLVNNAKLKSWLESILTVVTTTKTNYSIEGRNLTGAGMFVLYMYYQFNAACITDVTLFPCDACNKNGFPSGYGSSATSFPDGGWGLYDAPPWCWYGPGEFLEFQAPCTHLDFYNAMSTDAILMTKELLAKQGSTNTIAVANPGPSHTFDQIQQFQQSRFDPANWTNSSSFVQAFDLPLWQDQKTTFTTLMKVTDLEGDTYLFILYLLMTLSQSNATDQQLIATICNTTTSSIEYPNDTFINQLVYFVLIQMADPVGNFGYDNTRLRTVLNNLFNSLVVSNAAAQPILTSLQKHQKVLNSDASYPMQDPYSPNIGFDTRQSDTLNALDMARRGMRI